MDREVFLSLLALDSYNRGYGQNLILADGDAASGVSEIGRKIGGATVSAQSDVDPDTAGVNEGFYAIAYDWRGETIISYRGTNFFDFENPTEEGVREFQRDLWGGWNFFLGFDRPNQADLARALVIASLAESKTAKGHPIQGESLCSPRLPRRLRLLAMTQMLEPRSC